MLNFKISGGGKMWLGGELPGPPTLCMKPWSQETYQYLTSQRGQPHKQNGGPKRVRISRFHCNYITASIEQFFFIPY